MAGKGDTYQTNTLKYNLGLSPAASPAGTYLALFTAAPTGAGGGTEVSGGAYARQPITWGAPSGADPATAANSAVITFPAATAAWGTIVAFAIMDAASAGNIIYWNTLGTGVTVNASNQVVVNVGGLTATEQ